MIAKFDTAADLMTHYASVRERLRGPTPKVVVHIAARSEPYEPAPELEPKPEPPRPFVPLPLVKMPQSVMSPNEIRIGFEEIAGLVCQKTGYHRREIFAPRRTHDICYSRQLLWALARRFCWHMSLPQIGKVSGKRDHTTILHGCKKGVKHPYYNELCQVLEELYEEKVRANEALMEQAGV
jgi:hypothetical protein